MAPKGITNIINMSPINITYIQEPVTSPDSLHIAAVETTTTPMIEVDFGDFGGTLTGNVDIRFVYEDSNWIGAHVEMWEDGVRKFESAVTYNGYNNTITVKPFSSSLLADKTGNKMRVRFVAHVYQGLSINYLKALDVLCNVEPPLNDPFPEAKTNWTAEDYYDYKALNRVENMTMLVHERAEKLLDTIIPMNGFTTTRTETSVEFADSLNRLEENILTLGQKLGFPQDFITPVTSWNYNMPFGFNDANRLEKNLVLLNIYILSRLDYYPYPGQWTVGQEGVY